ncbi:DJ-1/PfpI family protein [bacterium]|nr:DJ-1/PfpI family protein [bacterium]
MKQLLLFLPKGFEEVEAAVFTDVMGWSRAEGLEGVGVTIGAFQSPIKATWNLRVLPDVMMEQIKAADYDALAFPGGFEEAGYYDEAYEEQFLQLIRDFDAAGKPIAAVCVGALPLGKSGVLKGRRGTTYHLNDGHRRKQLAEFGVDVVDEFLAIDNNIITSSCPSTGFDVAFKLLRMLTSEENEQTVRRAMGFQGN